MDTTKESATDAALDFDMKENTLDQCANRLASGPALVNVKRGMCKWKKEILRSKPCRTTNQGKAGKEIYEEMDKV